MKVSTNPAENEQLARDAQAIVDADVKALGQARRAKKIGGSYQADGTIVSTFATLAGETRHVFEFDQPAGMLHIFGPGQVEIAPAAALAAAPVQAQEPRKPTDISQRLREKVVGGTHPDFKSDILAAADEIERYYGGMMAWKQTAEKKDADWNTERMARVDERIANRNSAPAQPVAVPQVELLLAALNNIAEACNCCGDRSDLAVMAQEALDEYADAAPAAQGDAKDEIIRDLNSIGMKFAAALVALPTLTSKNIDWIDRENVMREVNEWRAEWDKISARRAAIAAKAVKP